MVWGRGGGRPPAETPGPESGAGLGGRASRPAQVTIRALPETCRSPAHGGGPDFGNTLRDRGVRSSGPIPAHITTWVWPRSPASPQSFPSSFLASPADGVAFALSEAAVASTAPTASSAAFRAPLRMSAADGVFAPA